MKRNLYLVALILSIYVVASYFHIQFREVKNDYGSFEPVESNLEITIAPHDSNDSLGKKYIDVLIKNNGTKELSLHVIKRSGAKDELLPGYEVLINGEWRGCLYGIDYDPESDLVPPGGILSCVASLDTLRFSDVGNLAHNEKVAQTPTSATLQFRLKINGAISNILTTDATDHRNTSSQLDSKLPMNL